MNPLVSHGLLDFFASDPTKRLKEVKAKGVKVIVIDPRPTETAGFADVSIQPLAGHDPAIFAALISASCCSIWNWRMSSALAVWGERPSRVANRPTSQKVALRLIRERRMVISSIKRWCSGLIGPISTSSFIVRLLS
ncbi:hypothetical protein [Sphingopyxis sp.]|uniref:hypothetical protein n=1 Tax=Sphingopyxis sp. TaxID=1908224 RepID=UPI001D784868|nr:hypothetical protein [Sphingopyxis sp.]MBW8296343.1 hypothetical protein [Sphingopyxis sp.]